MEGEGDLKGVGVVVGKDKGMLEMKTFVTQVVRPRLKATGCLAVLNYSKAGQTTTIDNCAFLDFFTTNA